MIVIDKISSSNIFFFKILALIGFKLLVYDSRNLDKEYIYKTGFIKKIVFNSEDRNEIAKINYTKYNLDSNPYKKYISSILIRKLNDLFPNIKNLENKFIHIFENFFWSLEMSNIIGFIYNHRINNEKINIIIHNQFLNFIIKSRPRKIGFRIIHLYLPFDDIVKIKKFIFKQILCFLNKEQSSSLVKNSKPIKPKKKYFNVGIIYQIAEIYGDNLYDKKHFYSSEEKSPLNEKNVIKFIVGNNSNNINKDLININLDDIDKKLKLTFLIESLGVFIKNINKCFSTKQIIGLLIISIFYLRYKLWKTYFSKYKIDNLIYDYDINFSKALSLALDSLSINTISICERPSLTTLNGLGVIVRNYIIPGKIYSEYAKNNSSFLFERSLNIGFWRLKYLNDLEDYNLANSDFNNLNFSSRNINNYKGKIVILGWYLNSEIPNYFINKKANEEFFKIIDKFSEFYKNHAIILRMKMINNDDENFILERFKKNKNVFLCNNYRTLGLSYLLCKQADLIVSLPTSLAEEFIAFGKKVIFIDDLFTIKNIASYIYPKEFKFLIASKKTDLFILADKIMKNDKIILKKYKKLNSLLKGDFEDFKASDLSLYIEKLLIKKEN